MRGAFHAGLAYWERRDEVAAASAQLRRLAFKLVEVACLIHLVLHPSAGYETGTETANRIPLRDGFMS